MAREVIEIRILNTISYSFNKSTLNNGSTLRMCVRVCVNNLLERQRTTQWFILWSTHTTVDFATNNVSNWGQKYLYTWSNSVTNLENPDTNMNWDGLGWCDMTSPPPKIAKTTWNYMNLYLIQVYVVFSLILDSSLHGSFLSSFLCQQHCRVTTFRQTLEACWLQLSYLTR